MSNKYGADENFVLAGGGNTSFKDKSALYVKGSGTSLATITESGFVKMDLNKLDAMWGRDYGSDTALAEKRVLRDMMDARALGEEDKRPSVETLLHKLMPTSLVLHVHPALVNGLTCGRDGEKICKELFGDDAVFMRATKPGYALAVAAKKATEEHEKRTGKFPNLIFMQNHGVFFGADSLKEMDALVGKTMAALRNKASAEPDFTPVVTEDRQTLLAASVTLRTLFKKREGSGICTFVSNKETAKLCADEKEFSRKVGAAFSPDHIVYCRHRAVFLDLSGSDGKALADKAEKAFEKYVADYGFSPKIFFVKNIGMFALGKTKKEAEIAREVFLDEIKISFYSQSFGGPLFMTKEDTDFILNWEVESYRQKVGLGSNAKRLHQKIAFITGAAQGYGKGIAEQMAAEGANVVIADLNYDGAVTTANEICERFGKGCAMPVKVDVSNEEDVKNVMFEAAVNYGGLDILVNNAGIVRAGSLEEMTVANFELVTKINYNAFFICSKYASAIMKIQHLADKNAFYDIIQINSKSGLSGSNKNFAYAGSKFGGIGLTQSFALELTPYNIKVNAICPGNFFDGPLWADPVKGLFVQYLSAGKVPGAKTVADVKAAYEAKIPMNRGCRIEDVARAIFYIVEQEYETGQAVPVTGGQEMLK